MHPSSFQLAGRRELSSGVRAMPNLFDDEDDYEVVSGGGDFDGTTTYAPPTPYLIPDDDDQSSYSAAPETPNAPPIHAAAPGFEANSQPFHGNILPPPSDMEPGEGFALRDWKRRNAMELGEKDRREREAIIQIREEADEYKIDFQRRRKLNQDTNMTNNREKEKLFLANQEKFHSEADKNYWKVIAELIPNEVPNIEKRRGKKEEKKPVRVVQGPKPGKPTDLSRMRHILLKLKHSPSLNMKPLLSPTSASAN